MKLKLVFAVAALFGASALAQAQMPSRQPSGTKISKADIEKVIQIISSDRTKTQQFCELGSLDWQKQELGRRETERFIALTKQAEDLEQKIGPEFVKFVDALDEADEGSSEANELFAAVEVLDRLCPPN
jgi:hypothetical protein